MSTKSGRAQRRRAAGLGRRRVSIERLESRMMLDAAAWPNNQLGTLQFNAGERLTVVHLVTGELTIGGTSDSPGVLTIAPSDASGNPLPGSISQDPPPLAYDLPQTNGDTDSTSPGLDQGLPTQNDGTPPSVDSQALSNGTWTQMTNLPPTGLGTMMLLSDGRVMAQGGGASWYQLVPNASGSYASGTWSSLASMSTQRLYFGSNILPSGKVFLVGGEYSGPKGTANWNNTGEIYDPVANTWSPIANFPQSQFGDDPTEVLPNGTVLGGYLGGPQSYIYNPTTNTWSAAGTKLLNDRSDEESWVKLPDGSILSYDIFASPSTGAGHAQRYVPSTNTWVDAGSVPVPLTSSSVGDELGPAFLLPDGRVLQIGANSNTVLYTPSTNTWVAGPTIPNAKGADDAPGAELPNGHVIFAADTFSPTFTGPTQLFDFDPTTNTITQFTSLPAQLTSDLSGAAFTKRMLVLPTGQVLLTGNSNRIWIFTPSDSPIAASQPTVSSVVLNSDGTYTLTGTQLNGVSEGAAYGDDAEMSSNYPIVQLTSGGTVRYARTFNWSSTGVQTGSTVVTTQFTLPAGIPRGAYTLTVIANGIASAPFSFVTALGVTSSTPASGSSVATPPASYVINFSDPIDPASLQATDLTVNGITANNVSLSANDLTATFTFNTGPVTTQGLQTMALAAGSVYKLGDPTSTTAAYNATFRYDAVTIQVTSTTPAAGGLFKLPGPFTFDVTFNEPLSVASVKTTSLTLSGFAGASVTGATVLNGNTTARFTLSGITTEGFLTATIAAGAVTDQFGNPGNAFTATYATDIGTVAFPVPLVSQAPSGSLIYGRSTTGFIGSTTETDTFTISIDPKQTISVLVTPTTSTFRPSVQLLDPSGATIATASAAAVGQAALIQTAATTATTTGAYKIVVSGVASTTGNYSVQVNLNAALEREGLVSGVTDDTTPVAQNVDASAVVLGGSGSTANRLGAVGLTDKPASYSAAATTFAFDNISSTGTTVSFPTNDDDATQIPIGFSFPMYGVAYTNVFVSTNGLLTFGAANTAQTNADLTSSPSQAAIAPFWDDLVVSGSSATKVVYQVLGTGAATKLVVLWNNVSFYNDSSKSGGVTFEAELGINGSIRFNYQTLNTGRNNGANDLGASATAGIKDAGTQGTSRLLLMFNNGPTTLINNSTSVVISPAATATSDFYSFTAAAGETDTLVVAAQFTANLNLDLLNASGSVIASATTGPTNLTAAISQSTFPAAGTYYLRVSGDANVPYSVVVTRSAAFDLEPNDTFAAPQSLAPTTGGVLGYVVGGSTPNEDWYSINVTGEQTLNLTTFTPGDGTGEFSNTLAPRIQLYSPSNVLLATGTVLADGRNESLSLNLATPGQYRVRVTSQNGASGEYFVSANSVPISNIQSVTIDDGTAQRSRVRSITLTFNGTIVTAPSSAFHLIRTEYGLVVPVVVSAITPIAGGQTQITLTFDGPSLQAGSLADGHYTLSIDGSQIIDSNGRMADAAGNGTLGSTRNVSLLRFFGDTNGDGFVDANDYLAFRAAYLSGDATGLNSAYDYDGDGQFTSADLQAFTDNLLTRVLL